MYQKIIEYMYIENSVHYLPPDTIQYKCRFCNQEKTKKDFSNKAHAVAECIGNKTLLSKYECDSCNDSFSMNEENELGRLFQNIRATHSLSGKKGPIKIHGAKFEYDESARKFHASINPTESPFKTILIKQDGESGEIYFQNSISIDFRLVYRALVKFALTVVNEDIKNELSKGYTLLRDNSQFPSYAATGFVFRDKIKNQSIAIYQNDDSGALPKYFATIDAYYVRYILPLDFDNALLEIPIEMILSVDTSSESEFIVKQYDYSRKEENFIQPCLVKGTISQGDQ